MDKKYTEAQIEDLRRKGISHVVYCTDLKDNQDFEVVINRNDSYDIKFKEIMNSHDTRINGTFVVSKQSVSAYYDTPENIYKALKEVHSFIEARVIINKLHYEDREKFITLAVNGIIEENLRRDEYVGK